MPQILKTEQTKLSTCFYNNVLLLARIVAFQKGRPDNANSNPKSLVYEWGKSDTFEGMWGILWPLKAAFFVTVAHVYL